MKIFFILMLFPLCLAAQENSDGSSIARTFINSLDSSQRSKTLFAFDDISRADWHYFPASSQQRNGIPMKDLNADQKEKLNALLQKFLSKEGYNRTRSIMDLEYILQELQPNNPNRIPENYLVAFYGTPAKNTEWGWKFSGHHVALNFTVIHDTIAFAPFFFGADPAIVRQGVKKGFRAIKEEEDLALELINSLTTEQKQKAIFQTRPFYDIVTSASRQVTALKPVGVLVSEMSEAQYVLLKKLIRSYLASMPSAIAEMRMKKIAKEDMNSLRFGWAGETERNKPHYYRIQGKTFLIEFDNAENNGNHIHLVWRDFSGDFGTDLLKEHYKNSKHHHK
jgi:hypothetical protein